MLQSIVSIHKAIDQILGSSDHITIASVGGGSSGTSGRSWVCTGLSGSIARIHLLEQGNDFVVKVLAKAALSGGNLKASASGDHQKAFLDSNQLRDSR